MSRILCYSNRHIQHQVFNVKKDDVLVLENELSRKRWSLYFRVNNIDEEALNITYIKQQEYLELENTKVKIDEILSNPPYQDKTGNENSTNSKDLYADFVTKSLSLDPDYFDFIIPRKFMTAKSSSLRKILFGTGKIKSVKAIPDETFSAHVDTCHVTYDRKHSGPTTFIDLNNNSLVIDNTIGNAISIKDFSNRELLEKIKNKNELKLDTIWNRGSLNRNEMSLSDNGYLYIEEVGKSNEPLKVQSISNNISHLSGFNNHKIVIPNMGTDREKIGAIKICKPEYTGGHSVVFLYTESDKQSNNLKKYLESNTIKFYIKNIKTSTPNSKNLFSYIPL